MGQVENETLRGPGSAIVWSFEVIIGSDDNVFSVRRKNNTGELD